MAKQLLGARKGRARNMRSERTAGAPAVAPAGARRARGGRRRARREDQLARFLI